MLAAILFIPPARFAVLRATAREVDRTTVQWRAREEILSRARVFVGDQPLSASMDPSKVPRETLPFDPNGTVSCQFVPKPTSGTTSKFDCRLDNGEIVKVKYGYSHERQAEIAATRLLTALGFEADSVTFVNRVRCFGCPVWPFSMRKVAEQFLATKLLDLTINYKSPRDFDAVSVERKFKGKAVEVDTFEGWDFRELTLVDASKGGATPAELDGLRLMSIFLAHWDNKSANHRLVCLGETDAPADQSGCRDPLLMLQDLGATFGPRRVNYNAWTTLPIWQDERTCEVGMESLPYEGNQFPRTVISEAGRALIAARLTQLSVKQIEAMFTAARFPDPVTGQEPAADITPWVRTFQAKVKEITDRRCQ